MLKHFHFWCQKVLPLVYDDSLSYYEVLCKVCKYINDLIDQDKIFAEDIDELKTEMQDVMAWVNRVTSAQLGEKIIFISDSYGNEDLRSNPWPEVFAQQAGLASDHYISNCEGGVGWTEKPDNNHNFLKLLKDAHADVNAEPYNWTNDEVTKIIVAGGTFRDLQAAEFNYDTLQSLVTNRVTAFMNYVRDNFPNAKVYYSFCSVCLNYGQPVTDVYWMGAVNTSFGIYANQSQEGLILLPNTRYVLMRNFRIDRNENGMLHPNGLGGIALGTAIHNAVYGSWFDEITGNVDVVKGDDNTSANCRLRLIASNQTAKLVFRDAANITIDDRAGETYTLLTLPDDLRYRDAVNSFTDVRGVAFAQARDSENHVTPIPVDIFGDGLALKARVYGANGKYTSLTIEPFSMICERQKLFQNYSA